MNILYKGFSFSRLIICMLIAGIISIVVHEDYIVKYGNLTDFYVGFTVFNNTNKIFDKYIFYIYSLIALLLYYIDWQGLFLKIYLKSENIIKKILDAEVGFLGKFITVAIFVFIGIKGIAPFISSDNYHFGETLVGNWLINENGYKLYSDFYPAHGIIDLIPSWIGVNVFHDSNVSGVILGQTFLNVGLLIVFSVCILSLLPHTLATAILFIFLADVKVGRILLAITFLILIVLLKNKKLETNFNLFTFFVCLSSYLLYVLAPAYGAPYILALVIPYAFRFIKYMKNLTWNKRIIWLSIFILLKNNMLQT